MVGDAYASRKIKTKKKEKKQIKIIFYFFIL
jgi:hypothetical protein